MGKKAITVDDSRSMREMVSAVLRGAGFEVIQAEDGNDALSILQTNQVDIIVTDLNMPHMDGIALVKALRALPNHRTTPILVLTSRNTDEEKAEGRAAGATGWLVKPFDPQRLVQVINRVCP
jgi:two-component system, chemotaxis family, chemotaxis protein CheY